MQTSNSLQSSKTELTLEIDSFDKPKELVEVAAWSQLILNLLYLKPGTYPSLPDMGIGIEEYQYDFIDDIAEELTSKITSQQKQYLPDVPLTGVTVNSRIVGQIEALVIQLFFTTGSKMVASAVAIDTSQRNFLTFDVSW